MFRICANAFCVMVNCAEHGKMTTLDMSKVACSEFGTTLMMGNLVVNYLKHGQVPVSAPSEVTSSEPGVMLSVHDGKFWW